MSQKRQKEIIDLLTQTLVDESQKPNGGNSEIVEQLTRKLEKVKNKPKLIIANTIPGKGVSFMEKKI